MTTKLHAQSGATVLAHYPDPERDRLAITDMSGEQLGHLESTLDCTGDWVAVANNGVQISRAHTFGPLIDELITDFRTNHHQPEEATMSNTTTITDDLPRETVKLSEIKPGQIFVFKGETLTLVKLGSDSFRAASAEGTVKSYKASRAANRIVERPVLRASFAASDVLAVIVADAKADEPAAPAKPTRTRKGRQLPPSKSGDPRTDRNAVDEFLADKPVIEPAPAKPTKKATKPATPAKPKADLPERGTQLQDASGNRYETRWVKGHHVLAKLIDALPDSQASKWLVQCEHGSQTPADGTREADRLGTDRAKWCASCAK